MKSVDCFRQKHMIYSIHTKNREDYSMKKLKKLVKCLLLLALVACGGYFVYTKRDEIKKKIFG